MTIHYSSKFLHVVVIRVIQKIEFHQVVMNSLQQKLVVIRGIHKIEFHQSS